MVEIGAVVNGTIEKVTEYGAFVKLESGESGMVHISQVDASYVRDINDFLHVGDAVKVKVIGQKEDGRIDLSIKQADPNFDETRERPAGRRGSDPDFEKKLKQFMNQSQERLVDLKRHREGRR